jgi:hypothetical protein
MTLVRSRTPHAVGRKRGRRQHPRAAFPDKTGLDERVSGLNRRRCYGHGQAARRVDALLDPLGRAQCQLVRHQLDQRPVITRVANAHCAQQLSAMVRIVRMRAYPAVSRTPEAGQRCE